MAGNVSVRLYKQSILCHAHYHKEEGNKSKLTRITSIGVDAIALPRLAIKLELKQQILKLVRLPLTEHNPLFQLAIGT